MLLVPLAELLLVGMAEEMMFRGVIFGVTERSLGSKAAIVVSALVFGLAHLPNGGFSPIAMAAIAAYGVLQAALYLKTRLAVGLHRHPYRVEFLPRPGVFVGRIGPRGDRWAAARRAG
ncbi:CPBP family intramembrane metalloprotease [Massilia sp. B-10]|nr:CPBP family intramembrane metalloprotease [Massilia sp. B-10]